jgi:hypothetical protein
MQSGFGSRGGHRQVAVGVKGGLALMSFSRPLHSCWRPDRGHHITSAGYSNADMPRLSSGRLTSLARGLPYRLRSTTDRGLQMGLFPRKGPTHLIPVSPDNAANKDWVILLEAGTIVGSSPDRLRVARSTLDKKIVKKYDLLLRAKHFLEVEGYDPPNSRRVFLSSTVQI